MNESSRLVDSVLVVAPSWVGDCVMMQSLLVLLAARNPRAAVDVLALPALNGLLARMPEVRRVIAMPLGHGALDLAARRRIGVSLRSTDYAQAIVLPNSFKSALVPWFADIPVRSGWRGEMRYGLLNDLRHLDASRLPLMVQRFAALAFSADARQLPDPLPQPHLRADPARAASLRAALDVAASEPILALCPGAEYGDSKRWPERHYAAVAAEMIGRGWQVWLCGSANDKAVTAAIRAALQPAQRERCADLAGCTTLEDAIDLLDCSTAVISNDSGLMHIAAALGKPLVAVYGGSSPRFTPPLSDHAVTLTSSIACAPCFQRSCRYGHYRCLGEQTPRAVLSALQRASEVSF